MHVCLLLLLWQACLAMTCPGQDMARHVHLFVIVVMESMSCHVLFWTRQDMARHVHLFVIVVMASMSRHILSWTRQDMLSTTTITNKHTCLAISCPGQDIARHACHDNNDKQTYMSCHILSRTGHGKTCLVLSRSGHGKTCMP